MVTGSEPLVSIVVPVYKAEHFLGACVESILNQSHHNLQLILTDDGSPMIALVYVTNGREEILASLCCIFPTAERPVPAMQA